MPMHKKMYKIKELENSLFLNSDEGNGNFYE